MVKEILDLKRRLRDGGQLRAGDSLDGDRYLLLTVIGRGGFATVWQAYDNETQRVVAVKVLHGNLAGDPVRLDRFRRGARIMHDLNHDGIVRVFETGREDGGWHFFVMEYVDGIDFRRAVLERKVRATDILQIILTVGRALAVAHRENIVHRDVKPANILLSRKTGPKLTDFDLVSVADTTGGTRTGAMGTFMYAAPEMMDRPQDAGPPVDVFGLGMTALFGYYGADLPLGAIRAPEALIDNLRCAAHIKHTIKKAISEDPAERFLDADGFVRFILDFVGDDVVAATGPLSMRGSSRAELPGQAPLPWSSSDANSEGVLYDGDSPELEGFSSIVPTVTAVGCSSSASDDPAIACTIDNHGESDFSIAKTVAHWWFTDENPVQRRDVVVHMSDTIVKAGSSLRVSLVLRMNDVERKKFYANVSDGSSVPLRAKLSVLCAGSNQERARFVKVVAWPGAR